MQYLQSSFYQQWLALDDSQLQAHLTQAKASDVTRVLAQANIEVADMPILLSKAAQPFLEQLAQRSQALTRQRFGHTLGFFIPLYLSNLCANDCSYCGFSMSNKLKRTTLTPQQVEAECQAIKALGFDNILLVTGEHETKVGMAYFTQVLPIIKRYFSYVMLEVQPLSTEQYSAVRQLGVDAVLVYQECYQQDVYGKHHLKGNKTDFRWRLETPDRLGQAEMDKVGLGCLLGLTDWRLDCLKLAIHLDYMQKRYWRTRYSVAFPRLRPCMGGIEPQHLPSNAQLVQLICAFRLLSPQLDIVMSTRESATLRDNILKLGITQISAGSKTQPGGYADQTEILSQFDIDDERSPEKMAKVVTAAGLEVVWKDWDPSYSAG
ncbi:2-iminoacetate synthase ThiH [uncultured Paraglaciecola sp.]|uniref:2-iminoacetate synthase ThiH n=1 Tax=uncultured Paraglaciecola sp. TaxID=1765024 RepID=UPI0030DADCC7|tara:strand:- start:38626 stop:39756 length:1131 start_codon:yes stop_codon:yes gene_type:complete